MDTQKKQRKKNEDIELTLDGYMNVYLMGTEHAFSGVMNNTLY